MNTVLRIGTRDSKLAVCQSSLVQKSLYGLGIKSELVFIKSEGDSNLITPLYAMGVEGIFTRALDVALLNNEIDIAVHSMKDVPVQLAEGIQQAAVLERGNVADIFVWNDSMYNAGTGALLYQPEIAAKTIIASGHTITLSTQARQNHSFVLATSSIRRKAQWLHHFPDSRIENIRGNINTRLQKVQDSTDWHGAIFAAAGLERINLNPKNVSSLEWMLPAPAQGAIIVVCRLEDTTLKHSLEQLNDITTALCTKAERDFLKTLLGGCSTPISAWAKQVNETLQFTGNITKPDGSESLTISITNDINEAAEAGTNAANLLLANGGISFINAFSTQIK